MVKRTCSCPQCRRRMNAEFNNVVSGVRFDPDIRRQFRNADYIRDAQRNNEGSVKA